jgi:two-component system sensor histidine kinase BaeS
LTGSLDSDHLAVLVHEVRSPVAALSAIAETLVDGQLDGETGRSLIKLVLLACRGIERIVTDAAVASIRPEPVDPVDLVSDVAAAARVRGAVVALTAAQDVPLVHADPARIRQALDNLIGNALVHGAAADGPVSVAVNVDAMVRIEISDTGGGIPAGELERIFEPRVRLEPAASEGAGLGLALARAIAEGHGGTLTATSSDTGATFTLSLPVHGR